MARKEKRKSVKKSRETVQKRTQRTFAERLVALRLQKSPQREFLLAD